MRSKKRQDTELSFTINNIDTLRKILGHRNEYINYIEKKLPINIHHKGNLIKIVGEETYVDKTKELFDRIIGLIEKRRDVNLFEIDYLIKNLFSEEKELEELIDDVILITPRKKPIVPKNPSQKRYVDAIRKNDMVFAIGPAGTGKTYLAVALAVSELLSHKIQRIILTRPAVEAGEKLGFLPGGLAEKVDPYLRPLYDALYDMLDYDKVMRFLDKGIIEIAPIAFMRGRTLNDSFVIMDEAQNTTSEQMKMFLTRLGFNSKAVITGDITQIDIPKEQKSGLVEVQNILKEIDGIKFIYFTEKDVVRHPLVQDIIKAYEKYNLSKEG